MKIEEGKQIPIQWKKSKWANQTPHFSLSSLISNLWIPNYQKSKFLIKIEQYRHLEYWITFSMFQKIIYIRVVAMIWRCGYFMSPY